MLNISRANGAASRVGPLRRSGFRLSPTEIRTPVESPNTPPPIPLDPTKIIKDIWDGPPKGKNGSIMPPVWIPIRRPPTGGMH